MSNKPMSGTQIISVDPNSFLILNDLEKSERIEKKKNLFHHSIHGFLSIRLHKIRARMSQFLTLVFPRKISDFSILSFLISNLLFIS